MKEELEGFYNRVRITEGLEASYLYIYKKDDFGNYTGITGNRLTPIRDGVYAEYLLTSFKISKEFIFTPKSKMEDSLYGHHSCTTYEAYVEKMDGLKCKVSERKDGKWENSEMYVFDVYQNLYFVRENPLYTFTSSKDIIPSDSVKSFLNWLKI